MISKRKSYNSRDFTFDEKRFHFKSTGEGAYSFEEGKVNCDWLLKLAHISVIPAIEPKRDSGVSDIEDISKAIITAFTQHEEQAMIDNLRDIQGVRLKNCAANVGKPTYSFNPIQIQALPRELRPPPWTAAGGIT